MIGVLTVGIVAAALAAFLVAATSARRLRAWLRRRRAARRDAHVGGFDPGRERRAEQRARELLRSCVDAEEWEMYRDLGFVRVDGRRLAASGEADAIPYAYLIYPHRPIVAYEPATGKLLSEHCVSFPDLSGGPRTRLPASDDVLAKWMALTSDESRLLARANTHLVGRQHDPAHVRRDIWRLGEWERQRRSDAGARAA